MNALDKAIEHFDTQALLARALRIEPANITNWKARGVVPLRQAIRIEALTGGAISASDLCPEAFAVADVNQSASAAPESA